MRFLKRALLSPVSRRSRFDRISSECAAETLEVRSLLTTYLVDTILDEPANNSSVTDGFISLREAIQAANNNTPFGDAPAGSFTGADTIFFQPTLNGQTITLGGNNLNITDELIIEGLGAERLTIDANFGSRHFDITSSAGTVEISGLTLIRGDGTSTGAGTSTGGSIRNFADLTLEEMWIENNNADTAGAINSVFGAIKIGSSTISNNFASSIGGGIVLGSTAFITNSTISRNTTSGFAGGIRAQSGTVAEIISSTITGNWADNNGVTSFTGGGMGIDGDSQVTMHNTIVAGNIRGQAQIADDIDLFNSATLSGFNNLIGDAATSGGLTDGNSNNIVGVNGVGTRDITTILNTTLQNNGGVIPTHSLLPTSVAVDAGENLRAKDLDSSILSHDGRGTPFARTSEGGLSAIFEADIGAYELQPTLVVNTHIDETTDNTTFSLREAIAAAALQNINSNADAITDEITFSSQVFGKTIVLNGADLDITGGGDLSLTGPFGNTLRISGNNLTRHFAVSSPDQVLIQNLFLIEGNDTSSNGGGSILHNGGHLTLNNMWITGNQSKTFGGGIDNDSGALSLTITDSTIDNNSARFSGGGVDFSGTGQIINSTISSNSTNSSGGGISLSSGANVSVIHATIFGNHADADGTSTTNGGGVSDPSTLGTFRNTIIAGNTSGTSHIDNDIAGVFVSTSNNNLIGDSGSSGGLVDGSLGNIVGVHVPDVLDPILRFNGGSTPTHALLPNSPAINRGSNASALDENGDPLTADQRGVVFPRKLGARVDIGAFEGFLDPLTSIAGFVNGKWWLAAPDAQGDYSTAQAATGPASTFQKVLTGDFNGDGIQDLAAWLFNGEWRVGLGNGIGSFDFSSWTVWNAPDIKEVHVGDFNQDGKDDIIGLFKNGTRGRWWVAQSNGQKFLNRHWGDFGNYNGIAEVLVGNFDGVKGDDLTIITLTGNVFVAKTSNTQFQYLLSHQWGINNGFEFAQVGDFNGDSRDDVVAVFGTGAQRSLFVAKSVGPALGFASLKFADLTATQSFDSLLVGDFDGDGKDDVAARINTTKWWVGLTGTNLFSFSLWTTWSFVANGLFDVHVGSTNGDHRSDIIGRDENGKWLTAEAYSGTFLNRVIETWSPVNWQFVNGGDYQLQPAATEAPTPEPALPTTRWMPPEEQTTNPTEKTSTSDSQDQTTSAPPADPESYELFGQKDLLEMLY